MKAKINEIYIIHSLSPYSHKPSSLLTTWRLKPFSSAGSSWLIVDWGKQSMPSEVSIDGLEQGLGYRCLIYEWKYALIQSNSDVLVYTQGQHPGTLRPEVGVRWSPRVRSLWYVIIRVHSIIQIEFPECGFFGRIALIAIAMILYIAIWRKGFLK